MNLDEKNTWLKGNINSSWFLCWLFIFSLIYSCTWSALGSEDVPHRPFAEWANLPAPGQLVVGLVYEESEAYHLYAQGRVHDVTFRAADGEKYGIDINQGYLALQYGLLEKWAIDLNVGAATLGWRYFDNGTVHSTVGLMDWSFGVRYQIFNETNSSAAWLPTLTARAGAVLPGSYDQNIAFAPGARSAAIEPELLLRKHVGWPGFGVLADALYRWNRTTDNDQYIAAVGLFQQLKGWELDVEYRHLQTIAGGDIILLPDHGIYYPRAVRENSDAIDAGFSYTTSKRHLRFGFHTRTIIDGSNTDSKFWVGGSFDMPFDLPLFGHGG
jgi:hypothetical protein